MSVELLREYVEVMVEKIRTQKNSNIRFGPKFDLKQFKSLEHVKHLNLYAETYLEKIGRGSSRAAYVFSSRYVLKIAVNNKGIAQNEAEVDAYTNPQSKPVIAKIYDFDPDYKWLMSELVRPLDNETEFEKFTGIDFEVFMGQVYDLINKEINPEKCSKLAAATTHTMLHNNILTYDIDRFDHWGATPDGRVVILDYGYTEGVFKSHYSHGPDRKRTFDLETEPSMKVARQKPFKQANVKHDDVRIGDTKNNVG